MALTVTELAEHIIARRRLYELALETDIELLRRAHGESVVREALCLANGTAQAKQAPQKPSAEHAKRVADALDRMMAEPRRERNRLPVPVD